MSLNESRDQSLATEEDTCRDCGEAEDASLHHGEEWDGIQAHSFKPGGPRRCPNKLDESRCDLALGHDGNHYAWPAGGTAVW
jgi:hypothetical protein